MTLVICPECNKEVSTHAVSCPNCGFPMPNKAPGPPLAECEYCNRLIGAELTVCPHCNVQVFKSHRPPTMQAATKTNRPNIASKRNQSTGCTRPLIIIVVVLGGIAILVNVVFSLRHPELTTAATPVSASVTTPPPAPQEPVLWNVESIDLPKGTIRLGMSSDQFVNLVSSKNVINQVVKPDPADPSSLVVRKDCKVGNIEFTVILARDDDSPYRIIGLLIPMSSNPMAATSGH